jgi:ATP-dependent exoDNAse (exonuclease V) beta subunit
MIHDELLKLDAANRERAIDPDSFIVEAPAGAGKTELLTQRYLALLNIVDEPEEIVAITFTNKAAAEMRSRILTSLQDAAENKPVDKPHKAATRKLALAALKQSEAQGWQLLTQPSRLRINTIDSFSSLLARQMPLLSRFGAQPAVIEDASPLYLDAASRAIEALDGEFADTHLAAPVRIALQYFDNDVARLSKQLADMLAKRDQWLPHASVSGVEHEQTSVADQAAEAFRHLIHHDIASAGRVLNADWQQRLMPIARYAASNLPCEHCVSLLLDWDTPILTRYESLPLWLAVCDLLLTGDGTFRKERGLTKNQGFPATDEGRAYKQALGEIIELIGDAVPLAKLRKLPDLKNIDDERRIVGALADLLKLATAHLMAVFQESGEVDFVEVSQRALFALEDQAGPTDLALKLDYRIRHLLVDEFQDTSPMQVQLLQRLMAGWEPGDGRTIFCVGDPMQSIYRFRKADVGLFLKVAEQGIGHMPLENLHLTRNNRSCPAVIDWVNSAFAKVFPQHDSVTRGAISYREFAATRDSLPGEGVQVHAVIAPQDTSSEALAVLEAQRIADIIEQEQAANPSCSIAVLVRARAHLHALVAEIRRNRPSLKFQAVKVESLAERQSIQDVLALTSALVHRADRVNWLAILRAPWCGLTLADLHGLAADDHHATIWHLMQDEARIATMSADGQQRLQHVRQVLAESLVHQGRQSVRRWVESTWLKLGGAQCLWDAGDVRDVQALFDLIDKLDVSGRFGVTTLAAEINKLYAAPDVHAEGNLQFMTIHNAKGLEFDTVILPGLHRQSANDDTPLILWEEVAIDDAAPQLVAAPWRPKHLRDDTKSTYDYLQGLESERSANETARVLYVAATRTIRRLHLVAAIKLNTKGEVKAPAGTFLGQLWDNVGAEFLHAAEHLSPAVVTPYALMDESTFVPQLIRLAKPDIPAIFSQPAIASQHSVEQAINAESISNRLDAHIGTLAHRYMEMIAHDGLTAWSAERLVALIPMMQHWLVGQGHAVDAAELGAKRVSEMLVKVLNSQDGIWVLQPRDNSGDELAITRADQQKVATHIMDRTFVDAGVRWIIDYKSAPLSADATQHTINHLVEQYRPQLEAYATLFTDAGLPIKKAILFLSIGKLAVLD